MTSIHTAPDQAPARPSALDPVTAWASRAGSTARRHRFELFILAGTVAFALLVALLALALLTG